MTLASLIPIGIRSHLLGAIGVLAVCGLASTAIAYIHIRQQNKTIEAQSGRIGDLIAVNKDWAEYSRKQQDIRDLEQENTRLLQDKLALIEDQSADASQRLKQLEASNAEVKEFLGRRIPADLRRLLEQK